MVGQVGVRSAENAPSAISFLTEAALPEVWEIHLSCCHQSYCSLMQMTGESDCCPCHWKAELGQNLCVFQAVTAISKLSSVRPLCKAHGKAIYML